MAIFKGAGVAIVTPMYEDGKVNYDNWKNCSSIRLPTAQMRSSSAVPQVSLQP